ncbi:GNAT family N-acetyltransferase [Aeromicrobium wangtongii]|uniref:GNAT family N-acetyltransferase n=1 Tax=Aeromicrobium wangtongii TaxID=2969247 RepID=A0ABY5M5X0_9ACTN|nr:GNAT family N-acetyltransferase [Aeromicrobium wangtongii]MCD9198530.1 GNAT family N-acetyltransferase [Aeromicrobium wangtongii]UUP12556.1 GNAT family N-acetyltransferase [Aeromicrobium wangtongii]
MSIRIVAGDELTTQDVYDIWKIRDAVFAVEQQCDEEDVDGRDLLPTMTHLWFADEDGPTSYLRSYVEDGVRHIGRVCTRKDQRRKGLSGALMQECHRLWGDETIVLNAQAYLEDWYGRYGYVRSGENYMEAGIDHVPMTRTPKSL